MNDLIRTIGQDRILMRSFLASIFILLITGSSILVFYSKLPPLLPLFNQQPWGENRLGTNIELFIPFGIIVGVLIINLILETFLYNRIPLLSRILSIITLLVTILLLLFTFRTIQLVL